MGFQVRVWAWEIWISVWISFIRLAYVILFHRSKFWCWRKASSHEFIETAMHLCTPEEWRSPYLMWKCLPLPESFFFLSTLSLVTQAKFWWVLSVPTGGRDSGHAWSPRCTRSNWVRFSWAFSFPCPEGPRRGGPSFFTHPTISCPLFPQVRENEKVPRSVLKLQAEDAMEVNNNFINCLKIENVELKSMPLSWE